MTTEDDHAVNRSAQNRRCKCGDEQSVRLHGARYTLGGKSQAAKVGGESFEYVATTYQALYQRLFSHA